jgi:hypothetical protein
MCIDCKRWVPLRCTRVQDAYNYCARRELHATRDRLWEGAAGDDDEDEARKRPHRNSRRKACTNLSGQVNC